MRTDTTYGTAGRGKRHKHRKTPHHAQGANTRDDPPATATGMVSQSARIPNRRGTALGWFSIGLGLTQLVAPGALARLIGARDTSRSRAVMRVLGVRELTAGLGLLAYPNSPAFRWGRVAGDVMDIALLGVELASGRTTTTRLLSSALAVAGVTALDTMAGVEASDHTGTDNEPGIFVTRGTTVWRAPEDVYQFWRKLENLPRFMAHLESVEVNAASGRSKWRAKGPAGSHVEWEAEIVEDRPNELLSWRSVEGSQIPNRGSVHFRPGPAGRGTEVMVELCYEPPGGELGAAIAKLFGEEPSSQIEGDLRRFKQVLETGEVVHSDASIHSGMHPARPAAQGEAPKGMER